MLSPMPKHYADEKWFHLHVQNMANDEAWYRFWDDFEDHLLDEEETYLLRHLHQYLRSPDSIQAVLHWLAPEIQEQLRRRLKITSAPIWREGRASFSVNVELPWLRSYSPPHIELEWSVGGWNPTGVAVHVEGRGGEEDIGLRLGIYVASLHLGLRNALPHRFLASGEREIGFSINSGALHIHLWSTPHEWTNQASWSDPSSRLRQPSFELIDPLLGKPVQTEHEIGEAHCRVYLPEGGYPLRVRFTENTWQRPRWLPTRMRLAQITCLVPIPIPGKGENSYDCEEDAVYSFNTEARTLPQAVNALYASVMRTRKDRANRNWRPARPVER